MGRLSGDAFGRMLWSSLRQAGVEIGVPAPSAAPTTLAVADVGPDGVARYAFHLPGTATADLDYPMLSAAMPEMLTAVYAGSFALALEPVASGLERLLAEVPPDALVLIDPNCRPAVIRDRNAYLDLFESLMHRADVVKVSVEDLDYLCPGVPAEVAATTLLGEKLALVLVTDGPRPARAFLPAGEVFVSVPEVDVTDTIGAGDAFGGAFLAWWWANGLGRDDLRLAAPVREALFAAAAVASQTCTRAGAEPPSLSEMRAVSTSWLVTHLGPWITRVPRRRPSSSTLTGR